MTDVPRPLETGRLIAHRGASGSAPENTLAAFREAKRQGVNWIEFDAALLADGEVVIHHDEKIDRCTNGKGRIRLKTWAELKDLDAGSWFGPAFAGEHLPTLDATLDEIERLGMFANLEIKVNEGEGEDSARATAKRLLARPQLKGRVVVSSFDHGALAVIRQLMPELPIALLYEKPAPDWVGACRRLQAEGLHIRWRDLSDALLETARQAGITVRVWTANNREEVLPYWPQKLDAVISNFPARFLADLASR